MKKILAILMAAALLALCMAGCGGSSSSAPAAPADSAPADQAPADAGSEPAADAAAAGPSLTAIQQSGVLTMMTATGFPPYEYTDENGKPAGVDIDIAQLVADELGVELVVLDMDFNLLVDSLKGGKGQMIAAGMSATPDRATQIDFSIPYQSDGQCLMIPVGSSIASAEDLDGKIVTVQEATTGHIYAEEDLGLDSLLSFKNAVECANAIMNGKADAAILDKTTVNTLVAANPDKLAAVPEPLTEEEYVLGIAQGNEDFLAIVNEVLERALADGTIEALKQEHLAICQELQNAG